jgi:hypothetical protein
LENGQSKVWGECNRATNNRLVAVELARGELDGNTQAACALKIVLSSGRWIEVKPDFDNGRSIWHYLFLLLTIVVPLFCIVSATVCLRSKVRRKWLWIMFILFGFVSFQLNWTTGQIVLEPLSLQFLGSSIAYGPWMISFSLPLGGFLVLLLRKKLLPKEVANQ